MNVEEFFKRLSYGDLADLAMGMEGAGTIDPGDYDRLTSLTNTALTAIYSRFSHNRHYVKLAVTADRRVYRLQSAYVVGSEEPGAPAGYLTTLDDEPFADVVKVIEITRLDDPSTIDVGEGSVLGINDRSELGPKTQMLSFDTIFLPEPIEGDVLLIEYRGRHRLLTVPTVLSERVNVAPMMEEALESRVASAVYAGKGGELHMTKSQQLMARYEKICAIVKQEDLLQETQAYEDDRLHDRGFI